MLVVDACDEFVAFDDPDLDPAEAHLEAGFARVQHLVPGFDAGNLAAESCHDPSPAGGGGGRGRRKYQACTRFRLVGDRLHDEVLVKRLECYVESMGILHHGFALA